jgi:hypothetical protein
MKNVFGYLFAAVSALAGIMYIFQVHSSNSNSAPVTNVFPALNTSDPTIATTTLAALNDPLPTDVTTQQTTTEQTAQKVVPYPVFLV